MKYRLFRNKSFAILWLSSVLCTFCLGVASMTETWYAIKILHLESEYGYLLVAVMLPRAALMAVGGVVADNFSKRNVIALTVSLRAILLLMLGGLFVPAGLASFPVLLLFSVLYGTIDACFWPSRDAFLVDILEKDDLLQANSIFATTGQMCSILTPALAGLLLAHVEIAVILVCLGVLLVLSTGVFFFFVRTLSNEVRVRPAIRKNPGFGFFKRELAEGFNYVRRHPKLSVLMSLFAVANLLFMGPLQQSVPLLATKDLAGGANTFGNLWALFAIGMASGGALMSFIAPKRGRFPLVMSMLLAESILLCGLSQARTLAVGGVLMFLIGLCVACNNVPTASMLQIYSDKEKLGRVMGLNSTISMGLTPLSYAVVAGILMAGIDHKIILMISGALMFFFCLFMIQRYPVVRSKE